MALVDLEIQVSVLCSNQINCDEISDADIYILCSLALLLDIS